MIAKGMYRWYVMYSRVVCYKSFRSRSSPCLVSSSVRPQIQLDPTPSMPTATIRPTTAVAVPTLLLPADVELGAAAFRSVADSVPAEAAGVVIGVMEVSAEAEERVKAVGGGLTEDVVVADPSYTINVENLDLRFVSRVADGL